MNAASCWLGEKANHIDMAVCSAFSPQKDSWRASWRSRLEILSLSLSPSSHPCLSHTHTYACMHSIFKHLARHFLSCGFHAHYQKKNDGFIQLQSRWVMFPLRSLYPCTSYLFVMCKWTGERPEDKRSLVQPGGHGMLRSLSVWTGQSLWVWEWVSGCDSKGTAATSPESPPGVGSPHVDSGWQVCLLPAILRVFIVSQCLLTVAFSSL